MTQSTFSLEELIKRCRESLPDFFEPGPIKISHGADGNFGYCTGRYFTTKFEDLMFSIYLVQSLLYSPPEHRLKFVRKEKYRPESRKIIEYRFNESDLMYEDGVRIFTSLIWD